MSETSLLAPIKRARPKPQVLSGSFTLSKPLVDGFAELARADYAQCEAVDFSDEEVRDLGKPGFIPSLTSFIAETGIEAQLRAVGLALKNVVKTEEESSLDRLSHFYSTCGVDDHEDHIDWLSVALVLHCDGFRFRQGDGSFGSRGSWIRLQTGMWFVFDDSKSHGVQEDANATSLVVFTMPVEPVAKGLS